MKKKSLMKKLLSAALCPAMAFAMATAASAAETVAATTVESSNNGLILLLSAIAITGLMLLIAVRWGKKRFF